MQRTAPLAVHHGVQRHGGHRSWRYMKQRRTFTLRFRQGRGSGTSPAPFTLHCARCAPRYGHATEACRHVPVTLLGAWVGQGPVSVLLAPLCPDRGGPQGNRPAQEHSDAARECAGYQARSPARQIVLYDAHRPTLLQRNKPRKQGPKLMGTTACRWRSTQLVAVRSRQPRWQASHQNACLSRLHAWPKAPTTRLFTVMDAPPTHAYAGTSATPKTCLLH